MVQESVESVQSERKRSMKERIKYQRAKSYLRANVEALTENTSNTRGFNKLIRSAEYP